MTAQEITSMRITKENRDWLEGLKRKWNKTSLDGVIDHFKFYYDGEAYDYFAENDER